MGQHGFHEEACMVALQFLASEIPLEMSELLNRTQPLKIKKRNQWERVDAKWKKGSALEDHILKFNY